MKIVIAPDSFKESLTAQEACDAIAAGLRQAWPDAELDLCPMADGGEGTVVALVAATGGELRFSDVRGPLGDSVRAAWGMLPDSTAVLEMAAASGLAIVPPEQRNPLHTSTFGTGQLILAALDAGAKRLIIGIGGSATNDGGVGCAQALGVRFLDADGKTLPDAIAGGELARIAKIETSGIDRRISATPITVACDVDNPLCGPRGASAIYGPQKGATPEMVAQLDRTLAHLADRIERDLGVDVRTFAGAGAAGGLGAGLNAFCNASFRPGVEIVMAAVALERRLADSHLLVTGEGRLDRQSVMGKVIAGVGRAGKAAGVPVVALVGSLGDGAEAAREVLDGWMPIVDRPMSLADAFRSAPSLLEQAATRLARLALVGRRLS